MDWDGRRQPPVVLRQGSETDLVDRQEAIRRAAEQPLLYLAAALAETDDRELAEALGADVGRVELLRLCRFPRAECWDADVRQMAELVGSEPREFATRLLEVIAVLAERRRVRTTPRAPRAALRESLTVRR